MAVELKQPTITVTTINPNNIMKSFFIL